MTDYIDRLRARVTACTSFVAAGIDPTPETLRQLFGEAPQSEHAHRAEQLGHAVVAAAADRAVAVKLQMAWFELAGAAGMTALQRVCDDARTRGLIVVLDGKRGDVPHSMLGYADAYLGDNATSGICADALTVNASIGGDALDAAMGIARARDAYLYALVHTSNAGAAELQDVPVVCNDAAPTATNHPDGGHPWWHHLAAVVERSGAGAVVGATYPNAVATACELMPTAGFLIPGIGAQGGEIDDLTPLCRPLDGSAPPLIAASRSLLPEHPTDDLESEIADRITALATATWRSLIPIPAATG